MIRMAVAVSMGIVLFGCASSSSNGAGAGDAGSGGVSSDGGPSGASDSGDDATAVTHPGEDAGPPDAGPGIIPEDAATIVLADGAADVVGPYGSDGPNTYTTSTLSVPAPNGTFSTTVYIPSAAGPMPVVILSSGLEQKGVAYAGYAERLASWGIVAFLRDDPGVLGEGSPAIASDVGYEISTWLPSQNSTSSSALAGKIDTTRIGLAGHSRGGQVSILAAGGPAHGLIKGMFGLDPVDSSTDGGGGEAEGVIAGVGVPLAFIGETTDSASDSCAPAADNYEMLYGAASSPIVAITAINADHTMFEDPSNCSFCSFCTAGTANQTQVIAYAERYLMAFFARELLGDTSVGSAFAGAGASQDVAVGLVTIQSK
jgi:dienelactone hydrolase